MFTINATRLAGIKINPVHANSSQPAYRAHQSQPDANFSPFHPPADQVTIRFGMGRHQSGRAPRAGLSADIAYYEEKIRKYQLQIDEYSKIRNLSSQDCRVLAENERNKAVKSSSNHAWANFHLQKAGWYNQVAKLSRKEIDRHIATLESEQRALLNRKADAVAELKALNRRDTEPLPRRKSKLRAHDASDDDFSPNIHRHKTEPSYQTGHLDSDTDSSLDEDDPKAFRLSRGRSRKAREFPVEEVVDPPSKSNIASTQSPKPQTAPEAPMEPGAKNVNYEDCETGIKNRFKFDFLATLGRDGLPPAQSQDTPEPASAKSTLDSTLPSRPKQQTPPPQPAPKDSASVPTDKKPSYNSTIRHTEDPFIAALLKQKNQQSGS